MINTKKGIALLTISFFVITTLPYIVLSFSCVPVADDFVYAVHSRSFGILGAVRMWYLGFTGRYMSSLIISAFSSPEIIFTSVKFFPLILLIGLNLSLYSFIRSFRLFSKLFSLCLSITLVAVYLSTLISPGEMIFWLSGSVTYTLPILIMLCFWAYVIRVHFSQAPVTSLNKIVVTVYCLVLNGSNELMIFYNGFFVFIFFLYTQRNQLKSYSVAIIALTITCLCSLISLFAPGNFVRHDYLNNLTGTHPSILHSIRYTSNAVAIWTYLRSKQLFFLYILIAVPALFCIEGQACFNRDRLKIKPIFIFLLLLAGHLIAYLPVTISLSEYYPDRTLDFIYFTYIILIAVTVLYTVIYYFSSCVFSGKKILPFAALSFGILIMLTDKTTNTAKAYNSLYTRANVIYKDELKRRFAQLHLNRGKKSLKLRPITAVPSPMVFSEIDTIPHSNNNHGYEMYFQIDTVISTSPLLNK